MRMFCFIDVLVAINRKWSKINCQIVIIRKFRLNRMEYLESMVYFTPAEIYSDTCRNAKLK